MKKLIINCFIFSFPLLVCLFFFITDDPFGVLFKDDCLAEGSDDVIKTRNFLKNKNKYSSFIFGNSRTHAFSERDWQKYIGNEVVFNYSSPGESVMNIKKKIELILKHQKIENALILIDAGILENTNNEHRFYKGPVYEHSPVTSNISYIRFYGDYIKYYFDNYFFLKHIYYKLTGKYKESWMKQAFKDPAETQNVIVSNQYQSLADSLINTDFTEYKRRFRPEYNAFPRKQRYVNTEDSLLLADIKNALDVNKVNYKVIIPPDFQGQKIAPAIYKSMADIFGKKLYDLTGINKISMDSTLNFENLHFTAKAGAMILDSLYTN